MDIAVGKMPNTVGAVRRKFAPWNNPSAVPLIRFEGLTKRFGEIVAIADFSLAITLPIIWPAVAAGWMLAFTLSLDDFVIASFTTGPGATTLPMRIYSQVRLGVTPEINVICTLFIAFVTFMVIIASIATKRREIGARRAARAGR